ncbi:uncharacterized protein LOC119371049 [Jatropha curcas]|uniref:uncharacterized protein LOC119371049 n=1 Tax=Jatropha curcas TaxID=180498 RepID=UPI001892DB47|nr:uncharacterized protein LOC119371049 [Jatropha curcas]
MQRRSGRTEPLVFDPEIEKASHRNNATRRVQRREQEQQANMADDLDIENDPLSGDHQILPPRPNHNNRRPQPPITLDAAAGGSFERKELDEAYDLIEEMASNSHYQNSSERKKPAGVYEINTITALNAKVDNMVRKFDLLTINSINTIVQACNRCNGQHGIGECMLDSLNLQTLEQVNYVMNQGRKNYPYSNSYDTYDNRLRNHPSLSYRNLNNALNAPPGFPSQEKKTHDDLLTALSKSHIEFMNETRENHKIQQAAIRNLEIQLAQFANMMASNLKVQAITLRNGKQLKGPPRKEDEKKEQKKIPIIDLDVFKKLQINIPFTEALAKMPSYAKFLKEILSKKRKIDDQGTKALADLGASVNLMSYEVFKMLGMAELKPTRMSLQFADRSIKYPRGIVEDVLVKISKFIFPVDFVILDDEDREGSLILGRPFLATARALIDVYEDTLNVKNKVTIDKGDINDQSIKGEEENCALGGLDHS